MAKDFKIALTAIDHYVNRYKSFYNQTPLVNKYKDKWAMRDLIDEFGYDTVSDTIDFYFKTAKDNHPLSWFYVNFTNLLQSMRDDKKDLQLREERRRKTQELIKEMGSYNANA